LRHSINPHSSNDDLFGKEGKLKYLHIFINDQRGLATAEYAVATVAACGFGGVLLKILGSAAVSDLLTELIRRGLGLVM
jgi:hypothetical protein